MSALSVGAEIRVSRDRNHSVSKSTDRKHEMAEISGQMSSVCLCLLPTGVREEPLVEIEVTNSRTQ